LTTIKAGVALKQKAFVILVNNVLCINLWTINRAMSSRGVVTMIYAYEGCYLDFITCHNRRHRYPTNTLVARITCLDIWNSEFGIRNEVREIWERCVILRQKSAYKFIDIVTRIDFSSTGNLLIGRTAQFPSSNINPQFFNDKYLMVATAANHVDTKEIRFAYGRFDAAIEI